MRNNSIATTMLMRVAVEQGAEIGHEVAVRNLPTQDAAAFTWTLRLAHALASAVLTT
jgi:hypothetical protein